MCHERQTTIVLLTTCHKPSLIAQRCIPLHIVFTRASTLCHKPCQYQRANGLPVERVVAQIFHIPPDLVVRGIPAHRKPPEVMICRLRNQSAVGTRPPSTS